MKQFFTAKDVSAIMGISEGKAYSIIRELNKQLEEKGCITVTGKVNREYFEAKCCYGGLKGGEGS